MSHFYFEATRDFIVSTHEVARMFRIVRSNPEYTDTVKKCAVILFMTKVESYIENLLEEFKTIITKNNVSPQSIPADIRVSITTKLLEELQQCREGSPKYHSSISTIISLWCQCSTVMVNFPLNTKFSYGKHGEKEIVKIFNRIGIDDIFERCKISNNAQQFFIGSSQFSITSDFNSLISTRNNIVHTDSSLTSLTVNELKKRMKNIRQFIREIDSYVFRFHENVLK